MRRRCEQKMVKTRVNETRRKRRSAKQRTEKKTMTVMGVGFVECGIARGAGRMPFSALLAGWDSLQFRCCTEELCQCVSRSRMCGE